MQVQDFSDELDRRGPMLRLLERYLAGYPAIPEHIRQVRLEAEYRVLMRQAVTNWPQLVVDSVDERLEVEGFNFGSKAASDKAWEIWQRNQLDADAGLIHQACLGGIGRAYAIVWDEDGDGKAEIVPQHASNAIVAYAGGSQRKRSAALKRWMENERWLATLYTPTHIYRFQAQGTGAEGKRGPWVERDDEDFETPHGLKAVPMVEFGINRALGGFDPVANALSQPMAMRPQFGMAYGEFQRVLTVIDRINTTIFALLLAQEFASFPVRALIGDPINWETVLDANGDPLLDADGSVVERPATPPVAINRWVQIENPDGRIVQLPESNLDNYIKSAEAHIRHLAAITKTPAHYLLGEMVNLSADAIRAAEAGLISKIRKHQRSLGESWEEVIRLAFRVENPSAPEADRVDAQVRWADPESRSLAERADAFSKLAPSLPFPAIGELVLGLTPQQIKQMEDAASSGILRQLVTASALPQPQPSGNGSS